MKKMESRSKVRLKINDYSDKTIEVTIQKLLHYLFSFRDLSQWRYFSKNITGVGKLNVITGMNYVLIKLRSARDFRPLADYRRPIKVRTFLVGK
jgi:hypothetical protein